MKTQKAFIQIPLSLIIIASVIVISVGVTAILQKHGELVSLIADISQVFKETGETLGTEMGEGSKAPAGKEVAFKEAEVKEQEYARSSEETAVEGLSEEKSASATTPELNSAPFLVSELPLTSEDLPGWYKASDEIHCGVIKDFIIGRSLNEEYITDQIEQCNTEFATEKYAFTWYPDTEIARFIYNDVRVFSNSEKAKLFFKGQYNWSLQAANNPVASVSVGTPAIGEEAFWHRERTMIDIYFRVDRVVVYLRYYGNPLVGKSLPDETLTNATEKIAARALKFTGK